MQRMPMFGQAKAPAATGRWRNRIDAVDVEVLSFRAHVFNRLGSSGYLPRVLRKTGPLPTMLIPAASTRR
jgi:hypothetical protein